MKFTEFEDEAKTTINNSLTRLGYHTESIDLSVPSNTTFGDLSSAVALRLAKRLSKEPSEIAKEIRDQADLTGKKYIEAIEAHESGYLNFRLRFSSFAYDLLAELASGPENLAPNIGMAKRVLVEHTNVNPNKGLHIGHARNLVLGDSLVRIMKYLGYDVQALNYVDDSGAQFADIIVGFKFLGLSDEPPEGTRFDIYSGDTVYVKVNEAYETNPQLREKQGVVLQAIERGSGEISEYARRVVERIVRQQLMTCWRMGAGYDLLNWESHILTSGIWERVFEQMKKAGLAEFETQGENAGCWVLSEKVAGEQKVLVRSDGTAVYVAKDIPFAAWKIGLIPDPFQYDIYATQPDGRLLWTTGMTGRKEHPKFGFADIAISVIDSRQSNLQAIVSKVISKFRPDEERRYIHRSYEVVALSKNTAQTLGIETSKEFLHMSGRKGIYINTETMLDKLREKAMLETRKRNPEARSSWLDEVAETIAVAALRFELVKQDPDKIIVFDLDEALKLEGETGPYLLYTYARARRILEKAESKPEVDMVGIQKLTEPVVIQMVKEISMFDKAVLEAREFLSPKEVARYAHRICLVFNAFYESVPVNSEKDENVRKAKLSLVFGFSFVLRVAMELIGIRALERI